MNDLLNHRGPDDEGYVQINTLSGNFKQLSGLASVAAIKQKYSDISTTDYYNYDLIFGHRRLTVIDLSEGGHGPMCDDSGKIWITYNGEIYNYLELRDELIRLGHKFRSQSDTEVILNSYKQWGKDCQTRFNGMWGFAIWDGIKRELFLSRDRFGVKPLYYIYYPGFFAFSSEIKPLTLFHEKLEFNKNLIPFFILYGNRLNKSSTYINGIYSLKPSFFLILTNGKIRVEKYYDVKDVSNLEDNENEMCERLNMLLTDSIKLRFRSDVPVGTCLSGGFDSSAIVSISSELRKERINTFSAVWQDMQCDESKYIDIVNKKYDCVPFKIEPKAEEFESVFSRLNYFQEIPSEGPGLYPQWYVMSKANGKVKVLLDGQGGDEVFGGYFSTSAYLVSIIKDGDFRKIAKDFKKFSHFFSKNGIHSFSNWMFPEYYSRLLRYFSRKKYGILNKDIMLAVEKEYLVHDAAPPKKFMNYLNNLSYHFIRNLTIPTLLHYEDRSSMAFSIESRIPFLDYRIVEFGLNLKPRYLFRDFTNRYLVRKSLEKKLPAEIASRKDKMGYPVPFRNWTRGILKDYIIDTLLDNNASIFAYVNKNQLAKNLKSHFSGRTDFSWDIWRLLSLESIMKIYGSRILV